MLPVLRSLPNAELALRLLPKPWEWLGNMWKGNEGVIDVV